MTKWADVEDNIRDCANKMLEEYEEVRCYCHIDSGLCGWHKLSSIDHIDPDGRQWERAYVAHVIAFRDFFGRDNEEDCHVLAEEFADDLE